MRRLHLFCVPGILWILACGQSDAPQRDTTSDLRSLPYLEFVEVTDPEATGLILNDPQRAQPGVNLYCQNQFAELLNMAGETVHRWQSGKGDNWHTVRLLDDGSLLAVGRDTSLMLKSWDDDLIWRVAGRYHHDLDVDAQGRILALARRDREVDFDGHKLPVLEDLIRIHGQDGELLEEYSVLDIVRRSISPARIDALADWAAVYDGDTLKHGTPPDLTHTNSARWLRNTTDHYRAGQILLSVRELDAILIFDPATRQVVWSWGPGIVDGQHHATELAADRFLLFDNFGAGEGVSRILEISVPGGEALWSFRDDDDFWSGIRGSVQRLENGNTLITESERGGVFEVTLEGERVWEWVNPRRHWKHRNRRAAVYRMERITEFPGPLRRRLRAALEQS